MRANRIPILAAAVPLGDTGGITYDKVVASLNYLVTNALLVGGFIAVGAIVYYGFRMTMSKGDPGAFTTARDHLVQACIGAAIIFGVYTIIASLYAFTHSIGQ